MKRKRQATKNRNEVELGEANALAAIQSVEASGLIQQ